MADLRNGMLVQHATLGIGKVIAVEPTAVHVFFAGAENRFAVKLRLPMALGMLRTDGVEPSRHLDGLDAFALDAKTGRYGRASAWMSHADAVARFTAAFPLGFQDPGYLSPESSRGNRAARCRRAHEAFVAALGEGRGERQLAAGDVAGLVEAAGKIERIVAPIFRDPGKAPFDAGRTDPALARGFFAALFDLLAAGQPDRARFEALAAAVEALAPGAPPESRWAVVTLLPFLARPDVHMVLRPHFACDAAQRLGLELDYAVAPNWATYESLLASTHRLLEKLRPLGARDLVDVEAFEHAALATPARAKAPARPKAVLAEAPATSAGGDEETETEPAEDDQETDPESEAESEL